MSRACRPTCESPISPSSSARGTSAATESMTTTSTAFDAHQHLGDLERLLAAVGLRDQQVVDVDAELAGVLGVERVLGVDEGGDAAALLGLGDDREREGRLAGGLRAEDLDHPAAREAADADGGVDRRASRWGCSRSPGSRAGPSRMIEPLPNCRSICESAPSTAFRRSNFGSAISSRSLRPRGPGTSFPGKRSRAHRIVRQITARWTVP